MALNPLTINVTTGLIGKEFSATISGQSVGSTVEVVGGGPDSGTPGFSTVNGRVYHPGLPYKVNTLVLRETKGGEGFRDSRIDVLADERDVGPAALPEAMASYLAGVGVVPEPVPQIACLGDSNTFLHWAADTNTPTSSITPPTQGNLQVKGFAFWAQALSGARVEFAQDLNFGVSGENSAAILERVDQAASSRADAVVVGGPTNDFGATVVPYETTIAKLTAIIAALRAKNKRIYLITVPPIGHPSAHYFTASDPKLLRLFRVNTWIKRTASQMRGVTVIDPWADIADPVSQYGDFKSGMVLSTDVAHYNPASAYYVGKLLAAEFIKVFPAIDWMAKNNFDLFDATSNPTGNLATNALMDGTGGTLSGTTPTPTGSVATGWSLSGADAGLTLAGSKPDSYTQRITLGGTPGAGADRLVTLGQAVSQSSGRIVSGDVLEAFAKVSVGPSTNLYGLALILQETYNPGSGNVTLETRCGGNGGGVGNFMPTEAWSGVLRLPPFTVPAGTLSSLQLRLRAWAQASTAVAATIDVTGIAVRKIIA